MNTWIFQGNPTIFKVDEYLQRQKIIWWQIRQKYLADEISIGDEVYIWRADGDRPKSGGIVAKGRIVSKPQNIKNDVPELWVEKQKRMVKLYVKIKLEEVRFTEEEGMLKRIDLEKDPIVKDMRILKFRSNTNYKLNSIHTNHIRELWNQKRK